MRTWLHSLRYSTGIGLGAMALALGACRDAGPALSEPDALTPAYAKPAPAEPATFATFRFSNTLTEGLMADGYQPSGDVVSYLNEVCGVTTRIFAEAGASGDATLQTRNPLGKSRCAGYPRMLRIRYVDANGNQIDRISRAFLNVRMIADAANRMAVGETREGPMALTLWDAGPGCSEWRWNPNFAQAPGNGSNHVTVYRASTTVWHVSTAPGARAYCIDDGQTYALSASLTVESSRALP